MGIPEELFVNPKAIPLRLYCSICLDVVENAMCTSCEHIFCEQCVLDLQATNGNDCECPNCRSKMLPVFAAKQAREFVGSLFVKCDCLSYEEQDQKISNNNNNNNNGNDHGNGCAWVGKYSLYHTHKINACLDCHDLDRKLFVQNFKKFDCRNIDGFLCLTREELGCMSTWQLKYILQHFVLQNKFKMSDSELLPLDYKHFIEKQEFVDAVFHILCSIHRHNDRGDKTKRKKKTSSCSCSHGQGLYSKAELSTLRVKDLKAILEEKRKGQDDQHQVGVHVVEKEEIIDLILALDNKKTKKKKKKYHPKQEKESMTHLKCQYALKPDKNRVRINRSNLLGKQEEEEEEEEEKKVNQSNTSFSFNVSNSVNGNYFNHQTYPSGGHSQGPNGNAGGFDWNSFSENMANVSQTLNDVANNVNNMFQGTNFNPNQPNTQNHFMGPSFDVFQNAPFFTQPNVFQSTHYHHHHGQ